MPAPTTQTLTPIAVGPNAGIADLIALLSSATSTGDAFVGTGREVVIVQNGDGSPHTVTVSTVVGAGGTGAADNWGVVNAAHDISQAIAAGKIGMLVPSTLTRFKDSNGLIQLTYDAVTSVKVGVFRFATGA